MPCVESYTENKNFADTEFSYIMSLISGKNKMAFLYCMTEFEPVRFNEMKRYLGAIMDKTLSGNLKEPEADHLIVRKEFPPDSGQSRIFVVRTEKVTDKGVGSAACPGHGKTDWRNDLFAGSFPL